MEILKATYRLPNVRVDGCKNIGEFTLEPVSEHPDDTHLRFDFTNDSKKDLYSESEKRIQLFSLVLSVLYRIEHPELETITDKSGVRLQVVSHGVRTSIELKQTDFDKIGRAYSQVKSMTCKNRKTFDFVARWVQKARGSYDVYDQFISYWIVFNFLYGHMHSGGNRGKIEEWVNKYCKDPYPSEFFAGFQQGKRESAECKAIKHLSCADADLDLKRTSKCVREAFVKLREKIKDAKFDLETLKYLILCIYGVRNSLFHGDWFYLDKTKRHVGAAKFLLYNLIRRGLKKQCNFAF